MNNSYKLFVSGVIVTIVIMFMLFIPRYEFFVSEKGMIRANRINGEIEVYSLETMHWSTLRDIPDSEKVSIKIENEKEPTIPNPPITNPSQKSPN